MILLKIVCKYNTTHTTSELVRYDIVNYSLRISQIINQPSGRVTTTGYCFSVVYKCYIFKLVRFEKHIHFSSSCPLFVILTHWSKVLVSLYLALFSPFLSSVIRNIKSSENTQIQFCCFLLQSKLSSLSRTLDRKFMIV